MKKILLSLIITFALLSSRSQGLSLGVKAGANFTTNTSKSFKENYQGGFQAGVFAKIKATSSIGVQVEGLVSNINLKVSPTATGFRTALTDLKATYLHIPILLNISPVPVLSFQVGPQIGMTVAQTSNALQNGQAALKNKDFNILSGIQLNLSKLNVFGRYSFGLSDIRSISISTDTWKSKMIQAGIGISL